MTDNVLVTGGTGFIGQHLVARLAKEGCRVRVLSRRADPMRSSGRIVLCQGDFTQANDLERALEGVDVVYHLAVTTVPGRSNAQIRYDATTNLMGSLLLLEKAAEAGVRRFIFTSSGGSVYGPSARAPLPEAHPTNPISAHGVSKLAIEKYLEIFRRTHGMGYCIARGSNPYGEGQDPGRGQGFIASALGRIARGEEIVVWGDGSVVRDYVYVGDVAEALWMLRDDPDERGVYNLGSGQGLSINEVIAQLEAVTGMPARVRYTPGRAADVPYNCLDITRIRERVGWRPRTPLPVGLSRTWSWVRNVVSVTAPALLPV